VKRYTRIRLYLQVIQCHLVASQSNHFLQWAEMQK
jgi:hypothetical protein